jgi:hypothetical protein
LDIKKRKYEFEEYCRFREYCLDKKEKREKRMREELEEAKNDFYSGNMDLDSQEDSQEVRPSLMENTDQLESKEKSKGNKKNSHQSDGESVDEESEDFNEDEWLKHWTNDNPEILIPQEKQPEHDLDLDPEFDLENFFVD